MHVIGTAGHVDHGKSTLVEAMTGIHPDRLKEEQEREMTIDLGFAWLTLPNGESVGIVDVPGHRDFIENMLAGVGGIDAALFVIAADEGVMPQTREHLAILDLLGIGGGVIALTKTDLVDDPEWLDLVCAEVSEAVSSTVLAEAPVMPVSARTGRGLDALLAALQACLVARPARPDLGRPRLPVDRVFTMTGFGTVVTGTLSDGTLGVGQEVEIQPQGLRARIRGLQTHKQKIERAVPGSRVAVNLAGVSPTDLKRGDVVTIPGVLKPTQLIDVRFRHLAGAPRPLRHNAEVKCFSGAAEVVARARLLGDESLAPGQSGWLQLRLAAPLALAAGDRFILRTASPAATIGGGTVVDPHPARRHRRFQPEVVVRLETLAQGTPTDVLFQALEHRYPASMSELVRQVNLPEADAQAALAALIEDGRVITLTNAADPALIARPAWDRLVEQIQANLSAYHRTHHLKLGMPREELKSRLGLDGRAFQAVVSRAAADGLIVDQSATVRLPEFAPRLNPEQERRADALLAACRREPYATPSAKEAVTQVGADAMQFLLDHGQLVQVGDDVIFLPETYQALLDGVRSYIQEHGSITVAQARDVFNTSRKYVLALLEHLDRQGITERVGDERVLT
jgi:selenocysteine-specific elongation factor